MKTRQDEGRRYEKQRAKQDGSRLHPGSGSGKIRHDASTEEVLYEYKNALKSHALQGSYLLGLFKRATQQGKEARYVVHFDDYDLTLEVTMRRERRP